MRESAPPGLGIEEDGERPIEWKITNETYNLKGRRPTPSSASVLPPTAGLWEAARSTKLMYFNRLVLLAGAAVRSWPGPMPYPDPDTADISYAT